MKAPLPLLQTYHATFQDKLPPFEQFAQQVVSRNDPEFLEGMGNYLHQTAFPQVDKEEFDDRIGLKAWRDQRPSWVGNVARGMGERVGDLAGGLATTIRAGAESMTGDRIEGLREVENALADLDLDYEARSTWEKVKEDPGFASIVSYGLEQGLVSVPDMVAAVVNLPAYVAARAGEMGGDRAEADYRESATAGDVIEMLPYALAEGLLERFGARKVLGITDALKQANIKGVASATARGAAAETGTEALQSALEEFGTKFGTRTPTSAAEIGEQALAGAVAGGVFGGSVRGVTATGEAVMQRRRQGEPGADTPTEEERAAEEEARRQLPPPDPRLPPPPIRQPDEASGPVINGGPPPAAGPGTAVEPRDPTIAMPDETSGPTINVRQTGTNVEPYRPIDISIAPGARGLDKQVQPPEPGAPGYDNPNRPMVSLQLQKEADDTGKRRRLMAPNEVRAGDVVVVDPLSNNPPQVGRVKRAPQGTLRIESQDGQVLVDDVRRLPDGVPAVYEYKAGRTDIETEAQETIEVEDGYRRETARIMRAAYERPDDSYTIKQLERMRGKAEFDSLDEDQKDAFDSALSYLTQRSAYVTEAEGLVDKVRGRPGDMASRSKLSRYDSEQWSFPQPLRDAIDEVLSSDPDAERLPVPPRQVAPPAQQLEGPTEPEPEPAPEPPPVEQPPEEEPAPEPEPTVEEVAEPEPEPEPEQTQPTEDQLQAEQGAFSRQVEGLRQDLNEGKDFPSIVQARKRIKDLTDDGERLTRKQADEMMETAVTLAARDIVSREAEPYQRLVALYGQQPNLGTRTSTSVRDQAYSTPAPLAYVASQLAGVKDAESVMEPTAGNGMLLMEADGERADVNEINPDRLAVLDRMGFRTRGEDAAAPETFEGKGPYKSIIANPPFGVVREGRKAKTWPINDKYNTTQIDHAIALNALRTLADDGKAVLIVGSVKEGSDADRKKGYRSKAKHQFYGRLYNEYNVTDHFTVSGDLYKKQGAGWPVDIVVIDGRGKSSLKHPYFSVPEVIDNWDALGEKIVDQADRPDSDTSEEAPVSGAGQRPGSRNPRPQRRSGQSGGASGGRRPQGGNRTGVDDGRSGDERTTSQPPGREDGGSEPDLPDPDGGRGDRTPVEPVERPSDYGKKNTIFTEDKAEAARKLLQEKFNQATAGLDPETLLAGTTLAGYHIEAGARKFADFAQKMLEDIGEAARPYLKYWYNSVRDYPDTESLTQDMDSREAVDQWLADNQAPTEQPPKAPPARKPKKKAERTATQVPYVPASKATSLQTLVPANLATAINDSLKKLQDEVGSPDEYVSRELGIEDPATVLGAEQVDALALALHNMDQGAGFIIGDQTGVGKGRVVAGVIRRTLRQGLIPIFLTDKPNLYQDMWRDMSDIGIVQMLGREDFVTQTNAGADSSLTEDGSVKVKKMTPARLRRLRQRGDLGDAKVLFSTYSQMQTVRNQLPDRVRWMEQLAPNAILILDESHLAGGSGPTRDPEQTPRSATIRRLIEMARGTLYSSATYAKRPNVMDLYSKTDMRFVSTDAEVLAASIQQGGIPMQQVVAQNLAEAGQYIRRERSFEDIDYLTPEIPVDQQMYSDFADILERVYLFSRHIQQMIADGQLDLDDISGIAHVNQAQGDTGASATNFASVMHNLIEQMLLAAKADQAAERAIQKHKEGKRPVITVANTMGAFLDDYFSQKGIAVGDSAGMTFSEVLRGYLDRARTVTFTLGDGTKRRVYIKDQYLDTAAKELYQAANRVVTASDFTKIPVSPIDWIHYKLRQAGLSSGEITGRQVMFEYEAPGRGVRRVRPMKETTADGKNRQITAFNDGSMDAIILNQSGSTGLSLHASERFKDQKQRSMIIAQAERNIDTHMQMLGRVHRTGQVVLPEFEQLVAGVPAEKRPAAVLKSKMASLNANTTAAREGALESAAVVDFLDDIGDQVADQLFVSGAAPYRELYERMGQPSVQGTSAARVLTGRIPLLPVKQQEEAYQALEEGYTSAVEQLEAEGQNVREAKPLPLDAKLESTVEVVPGIPDNDSPFAKEVMAGTWDVKILRKPPPTDDVLQKIADFVGQPVPDGRPPAALRTLMRHGLSDVDTTIGEVGQDVRKYLDENPRYDAEAGMATMRDFTNKLTSLTPGRDLTLTDASGNVLSGVAVSYKRKIRTGFPAAPSSWEVQVATLSAGQYLRIPLSQIRARQAGWERGRQQADQAEAGYSVGPGGPVDGKPIIEAFDSFQAADRENAVILTGNILKAFDWANRRGTIVMFEDTEGRVQPGIRMSQNFNLDAFMQSKPIQLPFGDAVVAWVRATGGSLTDESNDVQIMPSSGYYGAYDIVVPRSRARGARYFLNREILEALGGPEFESAGQTMRVTVPDVRMVDVVDAFIDAGVKFTAGREGFPENLLANAVGELQTRHEADPANDLIRAKLEQMRRSPDLDAATRESIKLKPKPRARRVDPERPRLMRAYEDPETVRLLEDLLRQMAPQARLRTMAPGDVLHGRTVREGLRSIVQVALDGNATDTLHHEVIHALRDEGMFTEAEWTALSNAARDGWLKRHRIRERYADLDEESQIEEAVAEEFAAWARNGGRRSPQSTLFRRIVDFFRQLAGTLRFMGFQPRAESVFEDVAAGRVGRRRGDRVKAARNRAREWHRRMKTDETIVTFDDPEVEKRYREAKGLTQPTFIDGVMERLKTQWRRMTRHREHMANTAENAEVLERMYHLEQARSAAQEKVANLFERMTKGLTDAELDLMTRKLFLDDLLWTAEQGMALPQGFRDAEHVKSELRKVDAAVEQMPQVMEAVRIRNEARVALRDRMVEAGVLSEQDARNPSYFRHQVLEYANIRARARAAGKKVTTPHWHKRKGSEKDINTNLFEAEGDWMFRAEMDIATANFLDWLEGSKHNRFQEFSRKAKADNSKALFRALMDEVSAAGFNVDLQRQTPAELARFMAEARRAKAIPDAAWQAMPMVRQYVKYRGEIGKGFALLRLAIAGMDERQWAAVPAHLRRTMINMEHGRAADGVNDDSDRHVSFEVLNWILESEDTNGALKGAAGKILGAVGRRRGLVRNDILGKAYINPRNALALIKRYGNEDELAAWQADSYDGKTRAVHMFSAMTIPERVVQGLLDEIASMKGLGVVDARIVQSALAKTKEMRVVGGPKAEMILPEALSRSLNEFNEAPTANAIDGILRTVTSRWKQWTLFNPRRFAKYYLNNMSGDIDALIANKSAQGTVRKLKQAFSEMRAHLYEGKEPSEAMREAIEYGVVQSSMVMQEIQDGFGEPQFSLREGGALPVKAIRKYFRAVQKFARLRENAVRYAAYLNYREKFLAGQTLQEIGYGASPPHMVENLTDPKHRAARMARDALGDYGNLSQTNAWMRDRVVPFWSWVATNTTRYNNLFRNAYRTGRDVSATRGAVMGAMAAGSLLARIGIFYGAVQVWNNLLFSDEEDEMGTEDRIRMHAIVGRDSRGRILTFRFQGALSDYLGWVGMEQAGAVLSEVVKGRASLFDVLAAVAKAPVNRVAGSINPVFKVPVELGTGQTFWPDVFNPRAIRDPWVHAVRTFSLQHEFAAAAKRLGRPTPSVPYVESMAEALIHARDPGQMAYDTIRGKAYRFLRDKRGGSIPAGAATDRGSALYSYRKALRFEDEYSADAALKRLRAAGGGNPKRSLKRASPLGMLSKSQRGEFLRTLTPKERDQLERASMWWRSTYLRRGRVQQ